MAYKSEIRRPRRINLWLHNGHYEVITSLKGFFASNFYCEGCEKPYDHLQYHYCQDVCHVCKRMECHETNNPKRCNDCDRLCKSEACFDFHKSTVGNQVLSMCDKLYQCPRCCKVIERKECPREAHRCGTSKCVSCEKYVTETHLCYLRKVSPKTPSDKIIYFDLETDQSSGEHKVNCAIAQYHDGKEVIFEGYTALEEFCSWLFSPLHKGFRVIAHNMKGFDGQFLLGWLLDQGTPPEVIPNGSKVMCITHPNLTITVIDSFNFLPMALSKLPSCFGIPELKKGYFPHLFNTEENQNYIGPLPHESYFSPSSMSCKGKEDFLAWYDERKKEDFNFRKEMIEYCRSDVDILRKCCNKFREEMLKISGVDPFCYVTIASSCMAVYRSLHIKDGTMAMIPVNGYVHKINYSVDSIRWLDFVAHAQNIQIQHALSGNGEVKLGGSFVDGYCARTNTIYQFHGCFYHGCLECYGSDTLHPMKKVPMSAIRSETRDKTERLRSQGFEVIELWEHRFNQMKRENPELQEFLRHHEVQERLNPRDSFFGGRTNAIRLFYQGDAKYVDFTSLYPWVNKYCQYPVGHPDIITSDFKEVGDYFGLIKCKVLPPRALFFPVLPYRCNEKLFFPLCRTCADTLEQQGCTHSEKDRAIIGTWVTEEVKLAVKKGYKVVKIYEVYDFKEKSDALFRPYIDLFLKIKQESSGWPRDCVTDEDKQRYLKEYFEKEGIKLDPENIEKNPGQRQVSKISLNSFWERWGMNLAKTHITFVNSLPEFNKILTDPTKKVKDIYFPSANVAALQWESLREFINQDTTTNIFIAAFTTAWARLKLYSEMDKLGEAVLYHDTDSIIYASNGANDPPIGNFLGEFTDELDGDVITSFVSGGAKNYAYSTRSGKTCCKIRGFSLNSRNSELLNFESLKHLVCSFDTETTIPIMNPSKITRQPKKKKVVNVPETKHYRLVYNKRVIDPSNLTTVPYGY